MSKSDFETRSFGQSLIAYLHANPDENDVTFLVGPDKEEVDALKLALKALCPALEKLFKEKWDLRSAKHKQRISLPELDPTAFRVFLQVILWDEWNADTIEQMDLKPDTISLIIEICRQLDMLALQKMFYSLKRRFPSFTTNPSRSLHIEHKEKIETDADQIVILEQQPHESTNHNHELPCKTRELATNKKPVAVSNKPHFHLNTQSNSQIQQNTSIDNSSYLGQNNNMTTGQHVSRDMIVGGNVTTVMNTRIQKQVLPVHKFLQIDSPSPNFTGRRDLLKTIHLRMQECSAHETFAERIIVLCGLGGIGKTELARMYAQVNINDPIIQNIAWIDAETPKSLKSSFDSLAIQLKLPPTKNLLETVNQVYTHFSEYVKTGLFIFDNAPQFNEINFGIYDFLPKQILKNIPLMLITSREKEWKIARKNIISVEGLTEDESFQLVINILQPHFNYHSDAAYCAIKKLAQAFQGFPLGISLAACNTTFINATDFKSELENYVERMNVPLGGWAKDEQKCLATRYKLIMNNVWDMTLEKIKALGENGRLAIRLLNLMAYLPADSITVELMSHLYNFTYGSIVTKNIFFILQNKSMASIANDSTCLNVSKTDFSSKTNITIHRLVQRITREKLDEKENYFYLTRICNYFSNMKLQVDENYSDDAIMCLHKHLKVRAWPKHSIRYSVMFCSLLTFLKNQNADNMFKIAKDVYAFLGIRNMAIEQLQAEESAANLFSLCCLWINYFKTNVEQYFLELYLDAKMSKQNIEILFHSLKNPITDNALIPKMDTNLLQNYLYKFSYDRIYRFLASIKQQKSLSAVSDAILVYEASMGQIVHEETFTPKENLERHSEIATKQALEKLYLLYKPATDFDLNVHTNNLLELIQTQFCQFQKKNRQNKANAEILIAQEIRICQESYTKIMKKFIEKQNTLDNRLVKVHAKTTASLITKEFITKHSECPLLETSLQLLTHQLKTEDKIIFEATKLKLEKCIQRVEKRFSEAVDYYRRQMVTENCKSFYEFHVLHIHAKPCAIEFLRKCNSVPDEILWEKLALLNSEISKIQIKTLCAMEKSLKSKSKLPTSLSSTSSPSVAIGIDFGSTSCSVAILQHPNKMPQLLKSDFEHDVTPSYVTYVLNDEEGQDGELHVFTGETAVQLAALNPEFTFFDIKRLIGRPFDDPHIQKYKELWPFHLVDVHGFVGVKVHEETLLPQTIATKLISHLKNAAEAALGVSVDSAVVTVPVYFTDLHKRLTKDACEKAGFKNIQFIVEPVAAAVAYSFETSIQCAETKTCLIYNLGGSTFDVTVFRLDAHKRIEIKATGGDDRLGGEDFNDLLTDYCLKEFHKLHGVNLADGKRSKNAEVCKKTAKKLRCIRNECEGQKCYLTSTLSVVVSLDCVYGDKKLVVPVTRILFEELIGPLLNQSIQILDETLKKSGCEKEEIDDVILIGGSSRIPKMRQMVQEYFAGRQICRTIDADEAVACGAAVHAFNVFKENGAPFSVVTLLEEAQSMSQSLEPAPSVQLSAATSMSKTIRWGNKINGFPPRHQHAAVAVGNSIYSFSGDGYSGDATYSEDVLDVFVLNVDEHEIEWKSTAKSFLFPSTPSQRFGHSAVAHKQFVVIFGGWDRKKVQESNSTYLFNTEMLKWDKPKVTGNIPDARCFHSAVVLRNEMFVYGGIGRGVTNDLHCLDLESFRWSKIEAHGILPSRRWGHSATVHNDRFILMIGGEDFIESKTISTVPSFDLNSKTWSALETRGTPPSSREYHCAFVYNERTYIFGGWNACYFNDVFCFDAETCEWKEVTPIGEVPSPRRSAGCVALNDQVFIFGGWNRKYCDDTHVLQM